MRWRRARCAATSSNAARSATAATSPIGAWCRTTTTWASRWPKFRRRRVRAGQARRHRRPDHPRHRGRADAVRDRRSARLHRARRGLRLHRRHLRAGRQGQGARVGRQRPSADRQLQGLDDLARRLQAQHHLHAGRPRGGGQGPAQRRRHHQEDATHVPRQEHGRLSRRQHRDHRRRGDLRSARAHGGQPRGRGQDRGQARPEGGAEPARPRDRADVDRRRGRHDRQLRRRPRPRLRR